MNLLRSPRAAKPQDPSLAPIGFNDDFLELATSAPAQPPTPAPRQAAGCPPAAGATGLGHRVPSAAEVREKQSSGDSPAPCEAGSTGCSGSSGAQAAPAGGSSQARRWRRPPTKYVLLWLAVTVMVCTRILWTSWVGWAGQPPPPAQQARKKIGWPARVPARRANLRPLAVMNESSDACAQASGPQCFSNCCLGLQRLLVHEASRRGMGAG